MSTFTATDTRPATSTTRSPLFNVLIGLNALAVLLQGLWAGIFLEHDGDRDAAASWIDVHARGGDIAIGLAAVATVVALIKLRRNKTIWISSVALTALLVLEAYIGGLIRDDGKDTLTAVHVPLGMAIMGLVIFIPVHTRRIRARS